MVLALLDGDQRQHACSRNNIDNMRFSGIF
jgi:hypothetical protein